MKHKIDIKSLVACNCVIRNLFASCSSKTLHIEIDVLNKTFKYVVTRKSDNANNVFSDIYPAIIFYNSL